MTHTLHRRGNVADLREDYAMLILPARGINREGCEEKMRQIWEVISHYEKNLANFGNHTRELVPGDHRQFISRIPTVVDAPVSTANTGVFYFYQNIIIANLWNQHFLDFDDFNCLEYRRLHLVCHGIYSLISYSLLVEQNIVSSLIRFFDQEGL